ncbi:MAG: chemotaxis protein CheW [Clostridiales bacterium]
MKILSFWIENELFGIDIECVKEINRKVEYTIVQRAPKNIVGLFNMRGQIVTIFNLADFFGYSNKKLKDKVTCIILKSEIGSPNQKGFIIDKSGDVIDVKENVCEKPPANVNSYEAKYIHTIVRLKNNLLRVIKADLIFE